MAKTTAIRAPTDDPQNHTVVLRQLKEASESGQRLRGDPSDSYVRVGELVNAGVVRFVNGGIVAPSPTSLPPTTVPSTRKVSTTASLTGGGTLASDLTLELVNDSASPGNNMVYGTNGSGVKGWYTGGGGGSSTLAGLTDVSITSPSNGQVLTYVSSASKWENQTPTGGSGSANITPDTHPASPTAWDDEFEYGTSVDTTGARFSGANSWTWYNQGTASSSVAQGGLTLTDTTLAGSDRWRLVLQAVPASGSWKFRAKMTAVVLANYQNYGLILYNSANGKLMNFGPTFNASIQTTIQEYTNYTTYSSNIYLADFSGKVGQVGRPIYYEIDYDGSSNITFLASGSGYNGSFLQVATTTVATFLGGLTHIGLGVNPNNATYQSYLFCDWFRRIA